MVRQVSHDTLAATRIAPGWGDIPVGRVGRLRQGEPELACPFLLYPPAIPFYHQKSAGALHLHDRPIGRLIRVAGVIAGGYLCVVPPDTPN